MKLDSESSAPISVKEARKILGKESGEWTDGELKYFIARLDDLAKSFLVKKFSV